VQSSALEITFLSTISLMRMGPNRQNRNVVSAELPE
jgi:hypothetical protein